MTTWEYFFFLIGPQENDPYFLIQEIKKIFIVTMHVSMEPFSEIVFGDVDKHTFVYQLGRSSRVHH